MKRLIFILIPFVCYGQTFKGFQRTQGTTFTFKSNELFESFPNSLSSNFIQNAVPNGWVAWFEPSTNVTLNGSTVSQWCDLTNTYCVTQGVAANQPTYVSGNYPYMSFNGTTNFLSLANQLGVGTNGVWTVLVIANFTNFTTLKPLVSFITSSPFTGLYTLAGNTDSTVSVRSLLTSDLNIKNGSVSSGRNIILAGEYNRTNGQQWGFLNGSYALNGPIMTALTNYSTGNFEIGRYTPGGTSFHNGRIYDIIIYNRQLSRLEYNSLYSFFKAKYNLP